MSEAPAEKQGPGNAVNGKSESRKERSTKRVSRFEPYNNPSKRYWVFVSNIPYDVKWQTLKDLMKEKVGEVTYVEHLMDAEGKSRGCAIVEFRTEEQMKKAVEKVNKHSMNGRPLKVIEDPDGVIAQREANKSQGGGGGGRPGGMDGRMGGGGGGPGGMGGRMGGGGGPGGMGGRMGGGGGPGGMGGRMGGGGGPGGMGEGMRGGMGEGMGGGMRGGMGGGMGEGMGGGMRGGMGGGMGEGMGGGMRGGPSGMGMGPTTSSMVNIPPSLMNNPNIPNEVIHGLQAGKIGNTVFVANLDYKVGWKKLKEVFGMAGVVTGIDFLEDKDGKSRGMGTVTFEMAIEAVQAVSMFNGQLLYNRTMHVKLDEKSGPKGDFEPTDSGPSLPRGLQSIGMGLGPGGQPIGSSHINQGGGMGNMGPGGMDDFGGGMNMDRFGKSGMGRMSDMDGGIGSNFDREFGGRNDMGMSRNSFGDSFDRGMGNSMGMDHRGSSMERQGGGVGRMGGLDRMDRMSDLDRGGSSLDRMGSGMDRLGMDRLGSGLDRMGSGMDRLGSSGFDRIGLSNLDRMSSGMDFSSSMNMDRMNSGLDRMGSNFDRMGSGGMDRFSSQGMGTVLDHMGSVLDRMGSGGMGGQFDRGSDMERGNFAGFGSGQGGGGANPRTGCQIFVRNLPFDFTWKMLKDAFNLCGNVLFADIKMENGKSKGCGMVRFDSPETAERACRTMNGYRLNGREIDVRIDRNA